MKALGLMLVLLAGAALAQPTVTRGGALKKRAYQTYGAMTLYVDPTGSDSGACTSSGTGACATINGAVGKVPKNIRHTVTINIAAGTYTENVVVSGFNFSGDGSLVVQGTSWSNITPATGTATGTATSYTAPVTSGTLTVGFIGDSGQTWTTDDLKGSYVTITSGAASGQQRVIVGNTATTLSLNSAISGLTASATYAIQRPAAIITAATPVGGVTWSMNGLTGGTSQTSPVILSDLSIGWTGSVSGSALRLTSTQVSGLTSRYSVLLRRMFVTSIGSGVTLRNAVAATSSSTTSAVVSGTNSALFVGSGGGFVDNGGLWYNSNSTSTNVTVSVQDGAYTSNANNFSVIDANGGIALSMGTSMLTAERVASGNYLYALLRAPANVCLKAEGFSLLSPNTTRCEGGTGVQLTRGAQLINYGSALTFTTTTADFSIDGDTYSLSTINALTPKRVVGNQGSTVLLQ